MGKPLISIITPCNRVIPWYNARLVNVCSQSFKDWEWIILDNSPYGCVKQYIDYFFEHMQGVYYPECRDKVKCYHEPFSGVGFEDGRMGKLRNRCLELTTCGDDGFILTLDSDDFIYNGFLEEIYKVSVAYPSCELINGMLQQSLMQCTDDGGFYYHGMAYMWNDVRCEGEIETLRSNGFDGVGFDEYAELRLNGNIRSFNVIDYESSLEIPHVDLCLNFNSITVLSENGYPFITEFQHPFAYKRSAFYKKIGGYITDGSVEDEVRRLFPFVFDDVVYINKPCAVLCLMLKTNGGERDSTTLDVINAQDTDYYKNLVYNYNKRVYNIIGDCMKTVKPIIWE